MILTFTGGGYGRSYALGQSVGALESQIVNSLVNQGWGITELHLTPSTSLSLAPYFNIRVSVNALEGDNVERVRAGLLSHFTSFLDEVGLQHQSGNEPSLLSQLIGGNNNAASTIAGYSLGTMAILAVAGLVILPMLLAPKVRLRYRY